MKNIYKSVLFSVSLLLSPVVFAGSNLLVNGSFESGDLSGWTVVNTGGFGDIAVYNGPITSNTGVIPASTDGTFASLVSQDGPGSHILYQDVTIPADTRASFFAQLFYRNAAGTWFNFGTLSELDSPNQHVRVDIMDPNAPVNDTGAGVLQNVFITGPATPLESGFDTIYADLSAFAGQTVRIRFAEVDNQFFLDVAFDNIIVTDHVSAIPANNPVALSLLVLAMLIFAGVMIRRSKVSV